MNNKKKYAVALHLVRNNGSSETSTVRLNVVDAMSIEEAIGMEVVSSKSSDFRIGAYRAMEIAASPTTSDERIQTLSKNLKSNLLYYFGKVGAHGNELNVPASMPFMKEFLGSILTLCDLISGDDSEPNQQ